MNPFYPVKGTLIISLLLLFALHPSFASAQSSPTITSFSPTTSQPGTLVTIVGTGFQNVTEVTCDGFSVPDFTIISPDTIRMVMDSDNHSGPIKVISPNGSAQLAGMTFTPAPPTLNSFYPTSGKVGDTITLVGTSLINVTTVTFGGAGAGVIGVSLDTLKIVLSTGATGSIVVNTLEGSATAPGFSFVTIPSIYYFSPSGGFTGTQVALHCQNLGAATIDGVSFAGIPAQSFQVVSDTEIVAVLGAGYTQSTTGYIVLTTSAGVDSTGPFSIIVPAPAVTSFTPAGDPAGSNVTIKGSAFTGATSVSFGGTPATNIVVESDSTIIATVGNGSSGNVVVTTPSGSDTLGGFTFLAGPTFTSFSPSTAVPGTVVTIIGGNFQYVTAVNCDGIPQSNFTIVSPDTLKVVLNSAAASGNIELVSPYGAVETGPIVVTAPPVIRSFSPSKSLEDSTVVILGSGFTGVTAISFGGTPAAAFQVVSDSTITAVVGAGATGNVVVVTAAASDTLGGFIYFPPKDLPLVASFSPTSASPGTAVTINGSGFAGAISVSFGGTAAASFQVISDNVISAVVNNGSSGNVRVVTPHGSDTLSGFTYLLPPAAPVITSFSPIRATTDSTVVILGSGFTGASAVSFGRVSAMSFQVVSDSRITAVVGSGASGNVVVVTAGGADTLSGFTYLTPSNSPVISSFFPTSAATDSTVLIQGSNFTGATAVGFGGTPASSFQVLTGDSIVAVVGTGATGAVSVTTPAGTGSLAGFTYIAPPVVPVISSFSPTSAPTDSTVAIQGSNFSGVTAVTFGGVPAASFRVVSANLIYAVVGSGATGNVVVTTSGGTDTAVGFTYIAPPVLPVINSFSPTSAAAGSTVTIQGIHFMGAIAVSFGGAPAASFTVVSDSTITAVVGSGASGSVGVTTVTGTGSLNGFTYNEPPGVPVIVSFSPSSGATDTTIVIQGSNFTGVTAVSFGGVPAQSFTIVSTNVIYAVVGAGASGNIDVTSSAGSNTIGGFTYIGDFAYPPFSLTSFTGVLVNNDEARLSWEVKNEQSISNYEIDAGKDSTSLTNLANQYSRDSASDTYTFVDPTLINGPNYFQLRIVDTAGNSTYSNIVSVSDPNEKGAVIQVSPNPAKGVVNVTLPTSAKPSTVQIMDLHGNIYYSAGVESNTSQVKVDFTQASGGIYIMSWSDGTKKTTKKIMVIN